MGVLPDTCRISKAPPRVNSNAGQVFLNSEFDHQLSNSSRAGRDGNRETNTNPIAVNTPILIDQGIATIRPVSSLRIARLAESALPSKKSLTPIRKRIKICEVDHKTAMVKIAVLHQLSPPQTCR
jgi:hypothetical protein